jgi:hypothetical protein
MADGKRVEHMDLRQKASEEKQRLEEEAPRPSAVEEVGAVPR